MEDLLKSNVVKPGSELHSKLESRLTVTDINSLNDAIIYYEDEEIIVHGKPRNVRRLYVSKADSDHDGVGWIINEDITVCMVCAQAFGFFRWAHHCRSCGNLVCNSCSPETAVIFELQEAGPVRVCIQCYWGQDPVHVSVTRRVSESEKSEASAEAAEFYSLQEVDGLGDLTPVKIAPQSRLTQIIPVPAFVVEALRRLSFTELARSRSSATTRPVFVNICMHGSVPAFTQGAQYFICADVVVENKTDHSAHVVSRVGERAGTPTKRLSQQAADPEVACEVLHVVVDPDALRISFTGDSKQKQKTDLLLTRIIQHIAQKFQFEMSKHFEVVPDTAYRGAAMATIYVPSTGANDDEAGEMGEEGGLRPNGKSFSANMEPCSDDDENNADDDSVPEYQGEEASGGRAVSDDGAGFDYDTAFPSRSLEGETEAAVTLRETLEAEARLENERAMREAAEREAKLAEKAVRDKAEREVQAAARREARAKVEEQERNEVAERAAREKTESDAKKATRLKVDSDKKNDSQSGTDVSASLAVAAAAVVAARAERDQKAEANTASANTAESDRRAAKAAANKLANEEIARMEVAEREAMAKVAARDAAVREAAAKDTALREAKIAAAAKEEEARSQAAQAQPTRRQSTQSSIVPDQQQQQQTVAVQIPEINFTPTPWCVIKTKSDDMVKCFVNVLHHGFLPNITETSHDTTAHEEYLNANYTQFTLNRRRFAMYVGALRLTQDKEGGSSNVCDVVVHTSVHAACQEDDHLVDKLFIKILKAIQKKYGVDLDADYKLPKILRNYKGADVLPVSIPGLRSNTATKLQEQDRRKVSRDTMADERSPTAVARASVTPNSSSSGAASAAAQPRPSLAVNAEWNQKWGKYIPAGRNVLYTTLIGKKNPLGLMLMRQLVLTDEPSLLYVDVSTGTVKGDIEWTRNAPPKATFVDKSNFEVAVAKRVYKFNDREATAAAWVKKINETAALHSR